MKESDMFKRLKRKCGGLLDFQRFETGMTAKGVPDVYFVNKALNVSGWIELKVARLTRSGLTVTYREGQQDRLKRLKHAYTLFYYDKMFYLTNQFDSETVTDWVWRGEKFNAQFLKILIEGGRCIH